MADAPTKAPPKGDKPKKEKDMFVEVVQWLLIFSIISTVYASITNWADRDPLFQHGWSGVTQRGIVLDYTRPIASLFNPVGAVVVAVDDPTAVENDAGGILVGYQKFGALGTIIGGPVNVGGVNYYHVDFQNNPDGWVAENRIAAQNGSPSPVARTFMILWIIIDYGQVLLWLAALCLLILLVRIIRKLTAIRVNNRALLYPVAVERPVTVNPKWARVQAHLNSANENDWRLAVIEADIMLGELLDAAHVPGDSIGDKLKGIERSDFTTIDAAWEAHKIRNQIAHSGGDFHLSAGEAKRVIGLYEKVFKEFQII